jgi:hypothetical protein
VSNETLVSIKCKEFFCPTEGVFAFPEGLAVWSYLVTKRGYVELTVATSVSFHILCFSLVSLRIFPYLNKNINMVFENGRWLGLVQGLSQSNEEEMKGKGKSTDCK